MNFESDFICGTDYWVKTIMFMNCSKSDHPHLQVSKAAADLMAYCDAHACDDPLITPVPTSENPFREKKFFCALL